MEVREQFAAIIEDNNIKDEVLAKLTDKSTPGDTLKITRKVETLKSSKKSN